MALTFPLNPSTGTTYTVGDRSWIWTGFAWALQPSPITSVSSLTAVTITITSSTNSTSTTTGALVVNGGVGIGGNLTVGGSINGVFSGTGSISTASNIAGGLPGQLLYQLDTGVTSFVNTATVGQVLISNGSLSPEYRDYLTLNSNLSSTSTVTGALIVSGGVGIGENLYVGGVAYVGGYQVLTVNNLDNFITEGTDIDVEELPGSVKISNTSTLQSVTSRGSSTNQIVHFTNQTESTSTTTGAVIIDGGLGVAKRVNCESLRIADTVFDSTEVSLNTNATAVIDEYSTNQFRFAKYLIQITEGTGNLAEFEAIEILLLATNTGTVAMTEYGLLTSNGEMGDFSAVINTSTNIVSLTFTPDFATDKVIKVLRTGMES